MIRGLGRRYDGHPDLDLLDIGSVGLLTGIMGNQSFPRRNGWMMQKSMVQVWTRVAGWTKRIGAFSFLMFIGIQLAADTVLDVAPAWSGHPVGFALLTHRTHQYVAF